MLGHELPTQRTQKAESEAKTGIIGSMYPYVVRSMAPGRGEGLPPPGKGGPPEDKPNDESDGEEDDGSDTEEETVSVTSSSQGSTDKMKHQKWGKG